MTIAAINHVLLDDAGVARIDGTRMKVIHLVKEMKAGTLSPERLRESFPHLTLAQIHAALAYYYDHQAELDAEIEKDLAAFDADRSNAQKTPGREKLRKLGRRP
jgi:uncharacterized protein (DUF433 family)